ncbi:hypothetical protein M427DRAFT_183493 [Gonapodya prolifera JEL478]|uniref:Uncharacterized protein n=1 Tax=Gonapodya prolifera (strain JEL478) TaxID=1344416 RepID=A0A139A0G7_GONPJ|nr:hypothetical protein M427DRAFT_183493 [Gonapodya prolifera JEL478]|eukprot:KXS10276.1 hypothetical protein M427DRAFT_183493 [Gonapodya prolifera JEL478]
MTYTLFQCLYTCPFAVLSLEAIWIEMEHDPHFRTELTTEDNMPKELESLMKDCWRHNPNLNDQIPMLWSKKTVRPSIWMETWDRFLLWDGRPTMAAMDMNKTSTLRQKCTFAQLNLVTGWLKINFTSFSKAVLESVKRISKSLLMVQKCSS